MKRLFFMASLALLCACGGGQKDGESGNDVFVDKPIEGFTIPLVLVENETQGLVGLSETFTSGDGSKVEILPVKYRRIEVPSWGREPYPNEIIATDKDGKMHLICYYYDNYAKRNAIKTVKSASKIEALISNGVRNDARYYLCQNGGKQSLVRVWIDQYYETEAHDAVYPIKESDTYLFADKGKYGYAYHVVTIRDDKLVESKAIYDDLFIYDMLKDTRHVISSLGYPREEVLGERFYCYRNENGSYTMCALGAKELIPIYTVSQNVINTIRSQAGVGADARLVQTAFFPQELFQELYVAAYDKLGLNAWSRISL